MTVRVLVPMEALPGKGADYVKARLPRHDEVRAEPGCEQFDLFQNTQNPDQLLLVERWTDEASLAVHAELNKTRPPLGNEFRASPSGKSERYITE